MVAKGCGGAPFTDGHSLKKGSLYSVFRQVGWEQRVPVPVASQFPSAQNNPLAYFVAYFGVAYSRSLQKPKNLTSFQNPPKSEIPGHYFVKLIDELNNIYSNI